MFKASVVWQGIVYTILMLFAKLMTGVWLIRLDISWQRFQISKVLRSIFKLPASCAGVSLSKEASQGEKRAQSNEAAGQEGNKANQEVQGTCTNNTPSLAQSTEQPPTATLIVPSQPTMTPRISKPLSLYPAAMLGTAMTARGEIGFLIASLAETTGLFSPSGEPSTQSSEIYLVVTWAIVLCTIIGPLGIGTLAKRVKRLQKERAEARSVVMDPLGIWGVA